MYVNVIPKLRLPRSLGVFSYSLPADLSTIIKPGQVVIVPFRRQLTQAVVTEVINAAPPASIAKQLKPIVKILEPDLIIPVINQKLLWWLAQRYAQSLPILAKTLIPDFLQRRRTTLPIDHKIIWAKYTARPTKIKLPAKISWLETNDLAQQQRILASYIRQTSGQILILVPQLLDLPAVGQIIPDRDKSTIAVLADQTNKHQRFQTWKNILTGQARYIVGTRQAVLAPFKNLELIIILDEPSLDYKQSDQNPRYDARTVAWWLAEQTQASLVVVSPTPRLETIQAVNDNKVAVIKSVNQPIHRQLISLTDQARGQNYNLLSDVLRADIDVALTKKLAVALFLNRRGQAAGLVCKDCQHLFTCPTCHYTLPIDSRGDLVCHHCRYRQDMPVTCPKCRGVNLKTFGRGLDQLASEIKKSYPQKTLLIVDEQTTTTAVADFYLGTEQAIRRLPWSQIGTVGVVFFDNLLNWPSFRSHEHLWQIIGRLEQALTGSQTNRLTIQTWHDQNDFWQAWKNQDYSEFWRSELARRKKFSYPPFGRLIKILLKNKNQDKLQKASRQLYFLLTKSAKQDKITATINQPQWTFPSLVRGYYQQQIIIKGPAQINQLLNYLPDNCLIDIDPENIS